MAYCTADDVRNICDISATDISDTVMESIIESATAFINEEINIPILEEEARYIDQYRENKKNGSNVDYYVQDSWIGRDGRATYIGDKDNDGDVDSSDVSVFIYDSTAKTRTEATVSTVDDSLGKITLSSAPSSGTHVYITYSRAPVDEDTPSKLIKEACKQLSAALAYKNLRAGDYQKLQLGDLNTTAYSGGEMNNRPFEVHYQEYEKWIDKIISDWQTRLVNRDGFPFTKVYKGDSGI